MAEGQRTGMIYCECCGRTLGQYYRERYIIRYHRREIITPTLESIRCDVCGRVWRPERGRERE